MLNCIVNDFHDGHISDKGVMLCATTESILKKNKVNFFLKKWKFKYNNLDYGKALESFLTKGVPIESSGILGTIRTIPYVYVNNDLKTTLQQALSNTNVTHIGKDSENGTLALITALHMAKHKATKPDIYNRINEIYDLENIEKNLFKNIDDTPICQNIIPQAILIFLKSNNLKDCVEMSNKFKGNSRSFSIITSTLYNLYNNTIDSNLLTSYFTYCTNEVFELVENFNKKFS